MCNIAPNTIAYNIIMLTVQSIYIAIAMPGNIGRKVGGRKERKEEEREEGKKEGRSKKTAHAHKPLYSYILFSTH